MPSAVEVWEGRGASGKFPRRYTYTRVFDVYTDSPTDDAATAGEAPGIAHGDPHPEDSDAFCVSIDPVQKADSPTQWTVTVGYDSHPDFPEVLQPDTTGGSSPPAALSPAAAAAAAADPVTRAPSWKVSFQQTQVPVRKAQLLDPDTGDPGEWAAPTNSAELPFDPPLMKEVSRPVITYTVNRASFDLGTAASLQDACNSDTWFGMAPRKLRCIGIEAQSQQENGVAFWAITYTLAVNFDGWDVEVLDAGYAELVPGSPGLGTVDHWEKITDEFGKEATEPVPLDGTGRKLSPGDEPVYRTFRVYREVAFATYLG